MLILPCYPRVNENTEIFYRSESGRWKIFVEKTKWGVSRLLIGRGSLHNRIICIFEGEDGLFQADLLMSVSTYLGYFDEECSLERVYDCLPDRPSAYHLAESTLSFLSGLLKDPFCQQLEINQIEDEGGVEKCVGTQV